MGVAPLAAPHTPRCRRPHVTDDRRQRSTGSGCKITLGGRGSAYQGVAPSWNWRAGAGPTCRTSFRWWRQAARARVHMAAVVSRQRNMDSGHCSSAPGPRCGSSSWTIPPAACQGRWLWQPLVGVVVEPGLAVGQVVWQGTTRPLHQPRALRAARIVAPRCQQPANLQHPRTCTTKRSNYINDGQKLR